MVVRHDVAHVHVLCVLGITVSKEDKLHLYRGVGSHDYRHRDDCPYRDTLRLALSVITLISQWLSVLASSLSGSVAPARCTQACKHLSEDACNSTQCC